MKFRGPGFPVLDSGAGFRVRGLRFAVHEYRGLVFRVRGFEFRVSRFGVSLRGFRVRGFTVKGFSQGVSV